MNSTYQANSSFLDLYASNPEEMEIECPRMEFLISQLQNEVWLTRQGLRADGLYDGQWQVKMDYNDDCVEIVSFPEGSHGPMLHLLHFSLEAQGYKVTQSARGIFIHDHCSMSPNIH